MHKQVLRIEIDGTHEVFQGNHTPGIVSVLRQIADGLESHGVQLCSYPMHVETETTPCATVYLDEEESEWSPIETAPKDGTVINLLSLAGEDVGLFEEERYCMLGNPAGSFGPGFVDQCNRLPMYGEREPTHWKAIDGDPS